MMRTPCCVPHCKRYKDRAKIEQDMKNIILLSGKVVRFDGLWLCGDHYKLVDAELRKLDRAAKKRLRIRKRRIDVKVSQRIWDRCARQAIERAGGIT